ncbi:adenosine deaminase-like isoform X2 [Lycorma delicatula]|uniref:adenosine deaminase-like isoform X2 n=1 Tax=Lycorma delicatula TaxID=130591 RepID=UPI003F514E0D
MDYQNLVELHVHLEGAVRHETLYELLKDIAVAERVAYEFCEEMSKNNVKYVEARYSPHNFTPDQKEVSNMTALEEAVKAVTRGFTKGELDFGVKARSILCGLNGTDGVIDVLQLSKTFKNDGVVGIDMATKQGSEITEEILLDPKAIYVYEEAKKCGIHRTLHAGETGGPDMIVRALDVFHTERIGHGYHVLDDNKIYNRCLKEKIHFECCPWSSLLTGSLCKTIIKHPIVRFAEDDVNFSINSDDPTVTGFWILDDYKLVQSWGISENSLKQANNNAAENCFLPEHEKAQLIKLIKK